jgi:NAD(P)-dependent dehydrogenase (short-subunit alcohol dehydrogenase family)
MQIAGSGAVVVGGASGMGRASAELLASKGARVAILDLPSSDGEAVARGLGDGAIFRPLDVMDEAAVEVVLAETVDALGGLRIAVNTAGGGVAQRTISSRGPHSLDDFRRVVEFNMVGTFNLNRWQAWNMRDNEPDDDERGVIINTASIAAYEGQIGQVAYSAAKAGIVGMTFTMARDLGRYGIRVNAIAPSLF